MTADTINRVMTILDNALDPQYSLDVAERKVLAAQVLALIAIAEELEKANEMKRKELRHLYGDRFV